MEPVPGVEQAKTATLEHFELIVQAFHKTTVGAGNKEGSNRLPPVGEGFEKGIKTGEATQTNALDPSSQTPLGLLLSEGLIKNGGKLSLKIVSAFQVR